MRDWLKTYGWLAGACLTAGWIAHELRHPRISLTMFVVGGAIIAVGILSVVFPMLNHAFGWAKALAGKTLSALKRTFAFLYGKFIAGVIFVIRPGVEAVVAEMIAELDLPAQNWLAFEKKYFDPQRGDLLQLVNDGFCPLRIVFSCCSTSPYWRAGLLLARPGYDPSRDSIFGGLLIHLASDGHSQPLHLYVYKGTNLVKHEVVSQSREPHRIIVSFIMMATHGDLDAANITVDGFVTSPVFALGISDWLAKPFLIAWADGRDFRVRFMDIRVRWVAHDF